MEYRKLGKTDLQVSRICVGCMTFGDQATNGHSWLLNQEETDKVVKFAIDNGVNFFDTANCYNEGTSEIYLGKALKKYAKREDVVIATKVRINEGGLSYEAIKREVDKSLKNLDTTYIDLLQIHRWDYNVDIEETMRALDEVINEGKVRYIGCSAMFAYQLQKAQDVARLHGYHTFSTIQNHYNLIYREEEREMIPLLEEEGMVMIPYSPLAAGRLARSWEADTLRSKNDNFAKFKYDSERELDEPSCARVKELADKHNVTMSQVSLSWMLSHDMIVAPIVGVTKIKHLEEAIKAVDFKLTDEEIKYLEELYLPHKVVGPEKKGQRKE